MNNTTSFQIPNVTQSGGNFTEGLVDWPPSLISTLRGCLGIVAVVGVIAEIFTLRRISIFLASTSSQHLMNSLIGRALDFNDLKEHPQLLFSFSICDILQCGLCAPLILLRKMSDFDMAWSWSDAIFRTIGSSHLLVIIFKVKQNLIKTFNQADKPKTVQSSIEPNNSQEYRHRQNIESSKFEGILEVFVLWLVGIFVISMIFMLCQALKYFASFENSDRILLIGVLIIAHVIPLSLLSIHGFQLNKLRRRVVRCSSRRKPQSSLRRSDHQISLRELSQVSDDSCTLMRSAVGKNKTNFSTLSLAGSFTKKQRRSSWNSLRKKSSHRTHHGEKMSPKLDRHPSLRYSIKRRSSSLVNFKSLDKQQLNNKDDNQGDNNQQHKDELIRTSQFLTVSPQQSKRGLKSKSIDKSDSEKQEVKPKTKTNRRRMRITSRTSASSGNESGRSSRSSSKSDRSSSSGRLERHPSFKFSTRKKIPRSHEVLDAWKRRMSHEDCGKSRKPKKKYFHGMGSHEVLNIHKSFKIKKERSSERNQFGGSMKMSEGRNYEGKKISKKLSPRSTFMSRSHSHADHKKLTEFDRHPSLRFSTHKISTKNGTDTNLLSEVKYSTKNLLIPENSNRKSINETNPKKMNLQQRGGTHRATSISRMRDQGREPMSQSHSYSSLRPTENKLGRVHSCRGSFVRRTRDNSSLRIPNSNRTNYTNNEITATKRLSQNETEVTKTTSYLTPEIETNHSGMFPAPPVCNSDSVLAWRDTNLCFHPLENLIFSTLFLNLPIALFFLLVLFLFNPSETSEMLVAQKMFSVCMSYATSTIRSIIISRSLTLHRNIHSR